VLIALLAAPPALSAPSGHGGGLGSGTVKRGLSQRGRPPSAGAHGSRARAWDGARMSPCVTGKVSEKDGWPGPAGDGRFCAECPYLAPLFGLGPPISEVRGVTSGFGG
jgi:hypothetical protein